MFAKSLSKSPAKAGLFAVFVYKYMKYMWEGIEAGKVWRTKNVGTIVPKGICLRTGTSFPVDMIKFIIGNQIIQIFFHKFSKLHWTLKIIVV